MSLALHWALQVQYMAKKKVSKEKSRKLKIYHKKKKKKSRKISRTEPG